MSKPQSMSVKDYLIRTLAVKLAVDEKMIDVVVSHQFQSANEAMDLNHSIEISGFGKFIFNKKKAQKKYDNFVGKQNKLIEELKLSTLSEEERRKLTITLDELTGRINKLKSTINSHD